MAIFRHTHQASWEQFEKERDSFFNHFCTALCALLQKPRQQQLVLDWQAGSCGSIYKPGSFKGVWREKMCFTPFQSHKCQFCTIKATDFTTVCLVRAMYFIFEKPKYQSFCCISAARIVIQGLLPFWTLLFKLTVLSSTAAASWFVCQLSLPSFLPLDSSCQACPKESSIPGFMQIPGERKNCLLERRVLFMQNFTKCAKRLAKRGVS